MGPSSVTRSRSTMILAWTTTPSWPPPTKPCLESSKLAARLLSGSVNEYNPQFSTSVVTSILQVAIEEYGGRSGQVCGPSSQSYCQIVIINLHIHYSHQQVSSES